MSTPLEQFLAQIARKGSWHGGGTVAALSFSLSAALLEKLTHQPESHRRLHRLWHLGLTLAEEDARVFASVIATSRPGYRKAQQKRLKQAIDIPCQVYEGAGEVLKLAQRLRRTIKPRFQSDVRCALSLARASQQASLGFINANLAWLGNRAYARTIHQRLQKSATHVTRS